MEHSLIPSIKQWMELDKEIDGLQKKLKELKQSKKQVSTDLSLLMKKNQLDCIDVKSGQIRYVRNKVKKGINQAYLMDVMEKYYKNKDDAQRICEYIQENRPVQETEKIQFKKDKIT